jgi:phage head maturation protease
MEFTNMAIKYSTEELEVVKLIEQKIASEEYTNPAGIEGFVRKSYFGKGSADITDIKLNDREFIAKITTNTRDRDNEIVRTEGIDLRQFSKNPVILWAHDHVQPAIGRSLWIKRTTDPKTRKTLLITKGRMAKDVSRSEEILTLMQQGVINTISIGFIPIAGHAPTDEDIKADSNLKGVRWVHDKVVLLEFSIVNVFAAQHPRSRPI